MIKWQDDKRGEDGDRMTGRQDERMTILQDDKMTGKAGHALKSSQFLSIYNKEMNSEQLLFILTIIFT